MTDCNVSGSDKTTRDRPYGDHFSDKAFSPEGQLDNVCPAQAIQKGLPDNQV